MSAIPKEGKETGLNLNNILGDLMKQAGKGQPNEWWKSFHYTETVDFHSSKLMHFARSALYGKAISSDNLIVREDRYNPQFEFEERKHVTVDIDNLEEFVKAIDGRLLYDSCDKFRRRMYHVFDDGALEIEQSIQHYNVVITLVTTSEKKQDMFKRYARSLVKEIDE